MKDNSVALNLDLYKKQYQALTCEAQEILYGGATRGGKSYFVRVALITWCTMIPGLQCLILREVYSDVLENHMHGPTGFHSMLRPYVEAGIVKITENEIRWLETGSRIVLSHCADERSARKAQGVAKDVVVFEEACNIRERYIRFIRGWITTTEEQRLKIPADIRKTFPKIIYTANPLGVSMGYFRRNFVKAAPEGEVFRAPDSDGGFTRVYIKATVTDNPSEDPVATMKRIEGLGDAALAKALIEGDWDAPIGDYFPQYDDAIHTTSNFIPPDHWFKFLSFDWGSAEPFAVIWWCVSDGVEFRDLNNKRKWFKRGALVAYREWYGCDPNDSAKGLQLRNEEIAQGILHRTGEKTSGLIVTDSLPFQDRGMSKNGKAYRIADVFAEHGCPLVHGNCARVTGWSQVRDRLIGVDGDPMILFAEQCRYTREYLPMIGRSKTNMEDAAESGEATHLCDCVRLACTTRPLVQDAKTTSTDFKIGGNITPKNILDGFKYGQDNNRI
jgi:hypothetical protein